MCVRNRFHTQSLGEGKSGNMHCRPLTTDLLSHPATFHSILRIYPKKQWDLCSEIIAGLPWLRIHLPVRETWVQSLVQEDPMCRRATNPTHHNSWSLNVLEIWVATTEPMCCNYWRLLTYSLCLQIFNYVNVQNLEPGQDKFGEFVRIILHNH